MIFTNVASVYLSVLLGAFFITQTQTEVPHDDHLEWVRVKNAAVWSSSILKANKNLIRDFPKTYRFIRSLATDVRSFVATFNPAYAAATVYFTGVVAISYHYSVEAQQQLQKAHFKTDDLQIIIDTEILPILGLLEKLHSGEDMSRFCQAKTEIGNLFGNALTSLQTIRKDVEQQMIESTSGAEKNQFLQWLSAAGAVGSTVAIATAPCVLSAFFACPQLMFGSLTLSSSLVSFGFGYTNKETNNEAMDVLKAAIMRTLQTEKVLRNARTDTHIMCATDYPSFPEKELKSLETLPLIKPEEYPMNIR